MKKTLLFMMFAVAAMCGYAQNANRSGFFLEIGAGAVVGDSPYTDVIKNFAVIDGKLSKIVKRDSGIKFNVGTGYRHAVSDNWAIELKAMGVKYSDIVVKLMPGARYTTKELFSNVSMYIAPNVGACLYLGDDAELGLGYSLALGLNLNESLSVGIVYDGQYIFDSIDYKHFANLDSPNWGTIGINIGYRF